MRVGLLLAFGAALLSATLGFKLSAREENWEHIKLTDDIFKEEAVEHDDGKKWTNVIGEWKDSGSSYSVVTPSSGWHFGPSRIWSKPVQSDKYVITSRGKTSGGKGCGHVFKYRTGSVSSYSLVTKAWGYFLWPGSLYISSSGKEGDPRISVSLQDKWYTLKSVVSGSNVKMYIDDKLIYTLDMKGEGADAKNDNYVGLWCHSSTQWEGDSFSVRPSGCSSGWVNYGNACYKFVVNSPQSWTSARADCLSYGSDLVSIADASEESFILSQAEQYPGTREFWIGLNDKVNQNVYEWSDKTQVIYKHWNEGEPNGGGERCVEMYTKAVQDAGGKWNDAGCQIEYNYICKEQKEHDDGKKWTNVIGQWKDSGSSYSVVTPNSCLSGWVNYGNACYKFVVNSPQSWTSARADCLSYGSDLVSIADASEESFILSQAEQYPGTREFWIGLNDKVNQNVYEWSDKTQVIYKHWNEGEPNGGGERCVEMYTKAVQDAGGKWNDAGCQTEFNYICKEQKGPWKVCPRLSLSSGVYVGPSSCAQSNSPIGAMCSFSCARGYRLIGPPSINCTENGAWTDQSANVTCKDINECELNNGGCSHKCLNVPGNFTCSCPDPGLNLSKDRRTCADINECELNNGGCTHKCLNVRGSFTCSCPDPGLNLADDRRTCVAAGVTVSCGENDMSITLPKSLVRGLDRRHLRLLNTSCQATETASHFILETPLTSCGTTTSHKNGVIVFNNKVLEIPVPSGRLVTDVRKIEVPFHCYYSDRGLVTGVGVRPSSRKLVFSESGQGNFTLSLDIFSSDSFQEKFNREDFPISVTLRAPLYIELEVHNRDKELSILAETCFATPSANPYTGPRYELITDGCAAVNTVKILKAPTVQQQRFSSELFKFMSDHPFVFIHCQVRICITADGPNSRCAQGCRKKAGLVRRDVSSDVRGGDMYSLAEGPVLLKDRLMKTPDVDQLRGSGIKAPLLIVMVVVGALCIMGVSYTIFGKTGRCSKIFGRTHGCRK